MEKQNNNGDVCPVAETPNVNDFHDGDFDLGVWSDEIMEITGDTENSTDQK